MKEKYIKVKNLSISEELLNFVNNELLPNTKLTKKIFGTDLIKPFMNWQLKIKNF